MQKRRTVRGVCSVPWCVAGRAKGSERCVIHQHADFISDGLSSPVYQQCPQCRGRGCSHCDESGRIVDVRRTLTRGIG